MFYFISSLFHSMKHFLSYPIYQNIFTYNTQTDLQNICIISKYIYQYSKNFLIHAFDLKSIEYIDHNYHHNITFKITYEYELFNIPNTYSHSCWVLFNGVREKYNHTLFIKYISNRICNNKLNINYYKIIYIPDYIGQLTNLQELYLHYNKITSIPESIRQLTNLQKLYLYNNQITIIPDSIGLLINLQILDLSYNQIKCIPDSILLHFRPKILL